MKMTKDIYGKMAKQASPPSTFVKKFCNGFFIWRRYLHHWTRYFRRIPYVGYGCKNARAAVSITLIGLAAILTAFKVYDNIAKLPVPVHWFLLPDFPTLSSHRLWNLKVKAMY